MSRFLPGLLLVASQIFSASGKPITEIERQRLVAHFQMTESWLNEEVAHLSPAQLDYRMAPGKWTIRDVLEHLTIAEPDYWQMLREGLKTSSHKKRDDTDVDVLWYGIDRSYPQKTGAEHEPKNHLTDFQAGLASFHSLRATMLEYAQKTNDDLRAHRLQDSGTDLYQWFLEISTHSQRHILQIREIKASSGFPRE